MSADNYYFIDIHPLGGFGVEMGFESSDAEVIIDEKSLKFDTLLKAEEYASEEYSEYGYTVSNRARILDIKLTLAKDIYDAELVYKCPNFHPAGQEGCDDCNGVLKGLELAQEIILNGTKADSLPL